MLTFGWSSRRPFRRQYALGRRHLWRQHVSEATLVSCGARPGFEVTTRPPWLSDGSDIRIWTLFAFIGSERLRYRHVQKSARFAISTFLRFAKELADGLNWIGSACLDRRRMKEATRQPIATFTRLHKEPTSDSRCRRVWWTRRHWLPTFGRADDRSLSSLWFGRELPHFLIIITQTVDNVDVRKGTPLSVFTFVCRVETTYPDRRLRSTRAFDATAILINFICVWDKLFAVLRHFQALQWNSLVVTIHLWKQNCI